MNLPISIDTTSEEPLYRQLYKELKEAILEGRLRPGQLLPPTRKLADMLGVSRITVVRSYRDLLSQGYLEAATGRGTFVSHKTHTLQTTSPAQERAVHPRIAECGLTSLGRSLLSGQTSSAPVINFGAATKELLPIKTWRQVLFSYLKSDESTEVAYTTDPFGHMPLRQTLAAYLRRARGLDCNAEQIALFQSAQHARRLVTQLLSEPGDIVAVENPGLVSARRHFELSGAAITPIGVDEQGISVSELRRLTVPPKLVYVTPSHQDPTGVVMSLTRRKQLLEWAEATGTIIIEDDFNNEYHFGTPAPRALQGLDKSGNVIYISDFRQVLSPLTNLGFVVLPGHLIPVFQKATAVFDRSVPTVEHYALREFIEDGHLERHISKTRVVYAKRRQSLIFSLVANLRSAVSFPNKGSGLYILIHLKTDLPAEQVISHGLDIGLQIMSTKEFYQNAGPEKMPEQEFIISFAQSAEGDVPGICKQFAERLISSGRLPISPTLWCAAPTDLGSTFEIGRGCSA